MANKILALLIASFSVWSMFSIYLFASHNKTMDFFGAALDSGILPDGSALVPLTTNGRYPTIDWQIRAPALFMWCFTNDNKRIDVGLDGLLFIGAWAPSWILIILESFRECNRRRIISFISIWGILQFNQSHGLITPLYLATHLITSPLASTPNLSDILIDPVNLLVLPASFVLGFVLPVIIQLLPAPSVISVVLKHSALGWYQQWNLWIALPHLILALILRRTSVASYFTDRNKIISLYRTVYAFAFALAALSHIPVFILSLTAEFSTGLLSDEHAAMLKPSHLLVPKSPFSGLEARDLVEGTSWLIQWDYINGNFSHMIWAIVLYWRAISTIGIIGNWSHVIKRGLMYFMMAGPIGVAVGMIWERDEFLFQAEGKRLEKKTHKE